MWVLLVAIAAVFAACQEYPTTTTVIGTVFLLCAGLVIYGKRLQRQDALDARMRDEHVPSMSPIEYEQYVTRLLNGAGWNARHCGRTGDQGCDVFAELRGFKAVCQVKLYRSRCGNGGVQEAIGARRHYGAQVMVVVAPNGFTRSAVELARSNGVHLLHHSELRTLEARSRIPH